MLRSRLCMDGSFMMDPQGLTLPCGERPTSVGGGEALPPPPPALQISYRLDEKLQNVGLRSFLSLVSYAGLQRMMAMGGEWAEGHWSRGKLETLRSHFAFPAGDGASRVRSE